MLTPFGPGSRRLCGKACGTVSASPNFLFSVLSAITVQTTPTWSPSGSSTAISARTVASLAHSFSWANFSDRMRGARLPFGVAPPQ